MISAGLIKLGITVAANIGSGVVTTSVVRSFVNVETLKTVPKIGVYVATMGWGGAMANVAIKKLEKDVDNVYAALKPSKDEDK